MTAKKVGAKPLYGTGPMTKHSVLPLPQFLHDAATDAAWRARLSRSEWIRRAMLAALEAEAEDTKAAGTNRGNRPTDSHPPGQEDAGK